MLVRERILRWVASVACRRAWVVIAVFLVLTAGAVTAIIVRGKFSVDLSDILPEKSKEAALYKEASERFAGDLLFIALESDDPKDIEAAKPYVDRMAEKLAKKKEVVQAVEYKAGEKARRFLKELVEERLYVYLDEEDRRIFARKLEPAAIRRQMAENRRKLEVAGADFFKKRIAPDPLNLYEIIERHRKSSGSQFVPKEGESYFVSPDGTMLIVVVQAAGKIQNVAFSSAFVTAAEEAAKETWEELVAEDAGTWEPLRGRVRVGHTGGYSIIVHENRVLKTDLGKCFISSLICVMIVFALGFRRLGALFYIGLPLVASVSWTLAAAFLMFGHISMMSGGFAAILVGLSVDFAIHIYNGYVAERERGVEVREAIEGSLVKTGSGIFFGAVTSALAFFGVMMTRFVGLSEFGFLAGFGVLLGMLVMLFVLPALLFARNSVSEEPTRVTRIYSFHLRKVAALIERRAGLVFGISAALTAAAAIFVYFTLTVWFFDSDLKNLRAKSDVGDLLGRVQKRFATNLEAVTVISRGKTEEEAHANAAEVLRRVADLRRGTRIATAPWPDGAPLAGRPILRVDGCIARVRRAEIVLPAGAPVPGPLAEGAEVLTRPDGSHLVMYPFRRSKAQLDDWTFDGPAVYWGGAELRLTSGRGTVMRWKHDIPAAHAQVTFAVRFLGLADKVTLGLGDRIVVAAEAAARPAEYTGKPWPPMKGDRVRFTLLAGASSGIELVAGRETILSADSVAFRVPSPGEQRKSAKFVAAIDADRVTDDIAASARASGLQPRAFRKFTRSLGGMVERAGDPKLLTLGELASGEFGALVKKYYAADPEAGGERAYSVATYLYPEMGELPREWYRRLAAALRPHGEISATRLLSLAIRDIVHEDFKMLTGLVFAAVVVALLCTFGSPVRLVLALGMLALGILAITHNGFSLAAVLALVLSAALYAWSLRTYSWSPKAPLRDLFESMKWSAAALGPVFASFALMLATLLIINHRLNLINVLVFPVLVGIGIDYGIHIVHRFRQSAPVREIVTETGRAFVLTTLTTMAGFGSLIWSRYKGLNSFGFVTILGMTFVLLSSLVALPAFLVLLERRSLGPQRSKALRSRAAARSESGATSSPATDSTGGGPSEGGD